MYTNKIEDRVLNALLFGNHPALVTLRKQYSIVSVSKREQDVSGFFTCFSLPENVEIIMNKPSFQIMDIYGDITGLQYGVSFILFVSKGCIDFLECVVSNAVIDKYPENSLLNQLYYTFSYPGKFPYNTKIGHFFMKKPLPVEKQSRDWNNLNKLLQKT